MGRKLSYKLNDTDNIEEKFQKIYDYLIIIEDSIREISKIKDIFSNIKNFGKNYKILEEQLKLKKSFYTYQDWNNFFNYFKINLTEDGIENFDPEHIQNLLKINFIPKKPDIPFIKQPRHPEKYFTIVLDLDETLIHFPDHKIDEFEKNFPEELLIRPFALQFIQNISKYFELIIFTAATKLYADKILDLIDPENNISHRLYDIHLDSIGNKKYKNLSLIGRDLSTVIIIEDIPENFELQKENGIHIKPWTGDIKDKIFQLLNTIFMAMGQLDPKPDDIRETLKELKTLFSNQNNQ